MFIEHICGATCISDAVFFIPPEVSFLNAPIWALWAHTAARKMVTVMIVMKVMVMMVKVMLMKLMGMMVPSPQESLSSSRDAGAKATSTLLCLTFEGQCIPL